MKDKIKRHYVTIIFIILILLGIGIRIYNFPEGIPEVNVDEMITAKNAKSISETGKDILGQSFPVYLKGWGGQSVVLAYFMAIIIKILGYNLLAIRLPMLIISCISLFIFYDLIKKITKSKNAGLIGLALVAISPWHIIQSMWSLDCNMFPHFLLISVDILYTAIIKNKKYLIYISMIFFAITLYCYGIAIYFTPLFLIITAIYLLKKKIINVKDLLISIAIFIILTLPIIITFAINGLHKGNSIIIFNITLPYYEDFNRQSDMLLLSNNKLLRILINFITTIETILFQRDYLNWNTPKLFGTIYHITIVFTILGIVLRIKNKKEKDDKIANNILIIWLLISFFTGILINNTSIHRINSIWYILLIWASLGIYESFNITKMKKLFISITVAAYTVLFISFSIYFNTNYKNVIANEDTFSRGLYQSLSYIKNIDKMFVYYDNSGIDIARKESNFIEINKDENKVYFPLNTKEDVENKLKNINDNEIIIYNCNRYKYNSIYNKEKYGNYIIMYK